ncbi:hypothetical protein ACRQ1B_15110 [Rhizobium panacihumi]|uniref:hypothetical protein n=1 Tax=Rhizobium panacihumi TaxID=2008450 RepID=UPI003D79A758
MIILEFLIITATTTAVILLLRNQIIAQVKEYRFYKANGWDFSVDSGFDKLKLDRQISTFGLNLTPWQRFYLFRPAYIINITVLLGFMIWGLF